MQSQILEHRQTDLIRRAKRIPSDGLTPRVLARWIALAWLALPGLAHAASPTPALSLIWGLPFAGLLLSIAVFPLVAGPFWHHHFGKIAAAWGAVFLLPFAWQYGAGTAVGVVVHAMVAEYIPFIALLAALYTVSGGICLQGRLPATAASNTGFLVLGAALASLMGTTGAAMLLIRPLLRANEGRRHRVHLVVFFIFLVANAGGSLTPLGDPPLFLGFLKGVSFLWTTQHLLMPMLFLCGVLCVIFFFVDRHLLRGDARLAANASAAPGIAAGAARVPAAAATDTDAASPTLSGIATDDTALRIDGKRNFFLLLAIIGLVLMSGFWRPGITFDIAGTPLALQDAVRDVLLFAVLGLSLWITPASARLGNQFDWAPIAEVGKLFAAIFVTIAPVIAMLSMGAQGPFAPLLALVTDAHGAPRDAVYFWATGLLSGFLDNAPTYLVFFNTAGGDAKTLMTDYASTLLAISAGSVFMGALSYIGNAPNFMVKAIAEERGVAMPSFFGYMVWSVPILLPLFAVMTWLFL
ncbi:sodium:proton antiporter [Robbsia sp. KACC 23696]|uniref:sodium:proton antiporter n=1 Tax=Robbsia sp. KACC 23696 TaxID=3149231 RepID=UPI00325A74C9